MLRHLALPVAVLTCGFLATAWILDRRRRVRATTDRRPQPTPVDSAPSPTPQTPLEAASQNVPEPPPAPPRVLWIGAEDPELSEALGRRDVDVVRAADPELAVPLVDDSIAWILVDTRTLSGDPGATVALLRGIAVTTPLIALHPQGAPGRYVAAGFAAAFTAPLDAVARITPPIDAPRPTTRAPTPV